MRRAELLLIAALTVSSAGCVFIDRSSVSSSEAEAQESSGAPSVSDDGRYVAFESHAANLVTGDTNGAADVFVRDHQTGDTARVSVDSSGTQATGESRRPSISDDGRFVAFHSSATNLVAGDTNGAFDAFVHDRTTGATERVSVDSAGTEGNSGSFDCSISGDGRYVAFDSEASNLVTGDTNNFPDVFAHDRTTGGTERVSVDSSGAQADQGGAVPSISDDGTVVAFHSGAMNLVPGDTNSTLDVFVHDRTSSATERVSVDGSGTQGNDFSAFPSISGDGDFVAFQSLASNLVAGDTNGVFDIFVHDGTSGATERVSVASSGAQGDAGSFAPSPISDDGRYVAFASAATNLVPGDTNFPSDVFVRDRATGITQRVSLTTFYQQANGASLEAVLSGDGRYVAFQSVATNLVQGDTNDRHDIFLRFALAPRPVGTTGSTSIPRGTTGQITITGAWLDPTDLRVTANPGAGVSIDQMAVGSPNTSAVLTITVTADAETGARDLLVNNPGNAWNPNAGGSDLCAGCLTVT